MTDNSTRISPTAFATGHIWVRLGLSHPALATARGKRLDAAFSMAIQPQRLLGGTGAFDTLMLARHLGIDYCLEQAIEAGKITQVIEIAAGFSGRGWRMKQKYGDKIRYMETDLPHMAKEKKRLLESAGLLSAGHEVLALDALINQGELSLTNLSKQLDNAQGLAVITEGLMSYLDPEAAAGLWARLGNQLQDFKQGLYLSDAYITSEVSGLASKVIRTILQNFVSGRIHNHFDSANAAQEILSPHGFSTATMHAAKDIPATSTLASKRGGDRVRVLEAWV